MEDLGKLSFYYSSFPHISRIFNFFIFSHLNLFFTKKFTIFVFGIWMVDSSWIFLKYIHFSREHFGVPYVLESTFGFFD